MDYTSETQIKRMTMRSWRRGTKEMDLIFGPWADANLAKMSEKELALYDTILHENDQDLMSWMIGQTPAPAQFNALIEKIRQFCLNNQIS